MIERDLRVSMDLSPFIPIGPVGKAPGPPNHRVSNFSHVQLQQYSIWQNFE
ncbi:hypothetical protein AG1IA_06621 [Rhizoctonia solani AG-1 IA]|uniref:Uncharacterized protein n=1 Tax=Thanatephorus cucumeris (strain AG1-IA) TaxID=983506 RepID=L8WN24_THACA|nr:hypothetical protein AG1IA_06621 [Rhizoctonia solani AG-1 IA]